MATAVGLDIGTHAIKIAEVRKTRHATTLVRLGNRATPLGATRSGVIVKPKEVAAEISALLRELRLRPQNVVTAVAGQGVILRSLLMPQMSRDEMAEAVRWEVDGQLPFRVDECVYDFDIVGEVFDHSIGQVKQRVSLVAAKKEIVDSYIETLRFCRILPKVIDVQPFGIVRSLSMRECWAYMAQETAQSELLNERGLRTGAAGQTRPDWNNGEGLLPGLDDLEHMSVEQLRTLADELESGTAGSAEPVSAGQYRATGDIAAGSEGKRDPQSCMVVLDIGAGTTDLVVLCGDELTFTRIIPMGGNDVTEAIENAVSCSREDAERLKRTTDWIEGTDLESGDLADQLVVSAIESAVKGMSREIRRTVDFYNASHKDAPVRGGVLVGGGARLVGFVEHLSHELGIPMIIGWPFSNLNVDRKLLGAASLQDTAPMMAVSIGLALRGVDEL